MRLKAELKLRIYGAAGSFPYFRNKVYFPKGSHVFERACGEGVYEKQSVRLIAALVRPASVYLDVGANIGLLAIPILDYEPACQVVSFEPSPNALPYLERTARESRFRARWRIVAAATGSAPGTADFFQHDPGKGAYDSLGQTGRGGAATSVTVPVTTIDAEWKALGRPAVSVIKMDIEGAEMLAIAGAEACLRQCRPSVLLEWRAENIAAFNCRPGALFEAAKNLDYDLFCASTLTPIETETALQLRMLRYEDYLLVPKAPGPEWTLKFQHFRGLR
jgi:FkbM family methyltransferase